MDKTQLVVTETFKTTNETERKKSIQRKADRYLKQQLEREGAPAGQESVRDGGAHSQST